MKFTLSWLKDYLETSATLDEICEGLIGVGLEVEEVSDMTAALGEDRLAELTAAVPLGRMATTEEIAGVVTFLASPDAAYITGAVIPVDGGLGMGH